MPPTLGNGKICYIEMPAIDVARSADFIPASLDGRFGSAGMVRRPSTIVSAR